LSDTPFADAREQLPATGLKPKNLGFTIFANVDYDHTEDVTRRSRTG